MKSSPLDKLDPGECICDMQNCSCPPTERSLRYVATAADVQMDDEQRLWCLNEIGAVEGYDKADHANESDTDIARGVLSAWTNYCFDKGLL